MHDFKNLFGIKKSQIQKNCLVVPFIPKNFLKQLKVSPLSKGKLFSVGHHPDFTFIHAGIGAPFVGDAILYLEDTPCKNIVFFGSCGAVPPVHAKKSALTKISELVCPTSALAVESFSQILNNDFSSTFRAYPNKTFLKKFCQLTGVKPVKAGTLGSLKLEEEILPFLRREKIDVVDMECSAFFAAAKKIKRRALALLFITDIIKNKPFYFESTPADKKAIEESIQKASLILLNLLLS